MYADDVIGLLKNTPGLTDREITQALLGPGEEPQTINQVCRKLARAGLIIRRENSRGLITNFINEIGVEPPHSPEILRPLKIVPPSRVPPELSQKARELGRIWAESPDRPRLSSSIKHHWDALIDDWVGDPGMPLAVRKMGGGARGGIVLHEDSRREIILTDNSPSQWAFASALQGFEYSLAEIKSQIKAHRIPFAFATKRSEFSMIKYRGTLSSCAVRLNKDGWKLCHIDPVGLRAKAPVSNLTATQLEKHFRLLLKPSNHFLVPKIWSGFGEIPEVIEEIRSFESGH